MSGVYTETLNKLIAEFEKLPGIGPKTAETAINAGFKVDILAGKQTIPGLVEAIEEYFKEEM